MNLSHLMLALLNSDVTDIMNLMKAYCIKKIKLNTNKRQRRTKAETLASLKMQRTK